MSDIKLMPLANFDPLRGLINRIRLTPVTFGILIFFLDLLVDGLLCAIYAYLHPGSSLLFTSSSDTFGLLEDYMAIITDFIYTPIIAGLYLWSQDGSTKVFCQLFDSKVFKSQSKLRRLIDENRHLYEQRYVFYIVFLLSSLFMTMQVYAYINPDSFQTVGGYIYLWPAASVGRAPFWFLMFYFISFSAFNVGVTIYVLRKVFRSSDIRLVPLHPDRCGGLGGINQYSNKIALGIGSIGLLMSAATMMQIQSGQLQNTYPVLLGIGAYIVLAPLFFFLPLGTAHDAMREAKDAELLKLSDRFRLIYDRVKGSVDQSGKKFNDELSKLENVKKLYSLAESFPVWPFDIQSLRKFLTIVSTPLLPALISIINNILGSYLPFF